MDEKALEIKRKTLEDALSIIKLRQRKVVERKMDSGEIKFSH